MTFVVLSLLSHLNTWICLPNWPFCPSGFTYHWPTFHLPNHSSPQPDALTPDRLISPFEPRLTSSFSSEKSSNTLNNRFQLSWQTWRRRPPSLNPATGFKGFCGYKDKGCRKPEGKTIPIPLLALIYLIGFVYKPNPSCFKLSRSPLFLI